jgi:hypothetical protein
MNYIAQIAFKKRTNNDRLWLCASFDDSAAAPYCGVDLGFLCLPPFSMALLEVSAARSKAIQKNPRKTERSEY